MLKEKEPILNIINEEEICEEINLLIKDKKCNVILDLQKNPEININDSDDSDDSDDIDKLVEKNEKENILEFKNKLLSEILKRDREIEKLKLKLSRFPFELDEGEKLISVILTSVDQKILHSIICKNTSKFFDLENKLYENYKEYLETENFFTVNGKVINRYKTLDENKIKDNDVIILNIIN